MRQAARGAESIVADEVSVRASVVRSVSGDEIEIEQSVVVAASGGHVEVEESAVFGVAGREVHLRKVRTVFLLATRVDGEVRTVFDWKGALAVGVGIVLTRRLLKLLRLA